MDNLLEQLDLTPYYPLFTPWYLRDEVLILCAGLLFGLAALVLIIVRRRALQTAPLTPTEQFVYQLENMRMCHIERTIPANILCSMFSVAVKKYIEISAQLPVIDLADEALKATLVQAVDQDLFDSEFYAILEPVLDEFHEAKFAGASLDVERLFDCIDALTVRAQALDAEVE